MASTPGFASVPRSIEPQAVSAANTNRDGSGTIVTLCAGATAGTKVNQVRVKATVTTTAGMVRLYVSTDTGSTWRLFDEVPVSAITVGASTPAFQADRFYDNLILTGASDLLGASTHNAEAFHVTPLVADL